MRNFVFKKSNSTSYLMIDNTPNNKNESKYTMNKKFNSLKNKLPRITIRKKTLIGFKDKPYLLFQNNNLSIDNSHNESTKRIFEIRNNGYSLDNSKSNISIEKDSENQFDFSNKKTFNISNILLGSNSANKKNINNNTFKVFKKNNSFIVGSKPIMKIKKMKQGLNNTSKSIKNYDVIDRKLYISPSFSNRINYKNNIIYNNIKLKLNLDCPKNFHNKIMDNNISTFNKSKLNDYMELIKQQDLEENKNIEKKRQSIKTGIYGPSDNISSIIRANLERVKIEKEYQGVETELKEKIIDEIMSAQVKLNIKPEKLMLNKKNERKPLFLQKMSQFKYLSFKNKIMSINQLGNIPELINDNKIMKIFFNDAMKFLKIKKYKIK